MALEKIYSALRELFDTEECFRQVCAIWENDRWFSRDKFNLTAQYCADTMEKAGLSVEMLPLRADGATKYFDWKMPIGWDAEKAILSYADGEVIADYSRMPCQLTMYCPSTPGAVEGEVIVPDKTDPDREKYRGKILFVIGNDPFDQFLNSVSNAFSHFFQGFCGETHLSHCEIHRIGNILQGIKQGAVKIK